MDAAEQLTALAQLRDHPGWKLFCAEYAARFDGLTRDVLDLTKPASEAESLRQARGRIEQDFTPQTIVENLLTKNRAAAEQTVKKLSQ